MPPLCTIYSLISSELPGLRRQAVFAPALHCSPREGCNGFAALRKYDRSRCSTDFCKLLSSHVSVSGPSVTLPLKCSEACDGHTAAKRQEQLSRVHDFGIFRRGPSAVWVVEAAP